MSNLRLPDLIITLLHRASMVYIGIRLGAILCVPVWVLFMLGGTMLWSFYRLTGAAQPAGKARS